MQKYFLYKLKKCLINVIFYTIFQISSKKLKKYEKEHIAMKEAQMQQEDPIERVEVSLWK